MEPIRFVGARQACNNAGLGFDIPINQREQEFIQAWQSELGISHLWLGGYDSNEEGTWHTGRGGTFWNGGVLGAPVPGVYVNWRPNQPDNFNEAQHCVSQMPQGGWDDEACGLAHAYFCSIRPKSRADCGNGILDGDEVCDQAGATRDCDEDCTIASCGDGLVNTEAGEECDDQNGEELDACANECKKTGLIAHYPLHERIGSLAWDVASRRHHGNMVNGATFSTDGSGVIFDGMTQYINVPEGSAPRVDGEVTLAALVRANLPLPVDPTFQVIVTQWDADEETWLRLRGDTVQGGAWWGEGINAATYSLVDVWKTPDFHHLVARYDGGAWAIFHDGELVLSQDAEIGALPATGPLNIGGRSDGGRNLAGTIRNVRVYDRALPDELIQTLAERSLEGSIH